MVERDKKGTKKAPPRRLTIRMEGASEDRGHVRLSDFLAQLDAVRALLASVQPAAPGVSRYYRIVALKHSSPAQVVLEEVEEVRAPNGMIRISVAPAKGPASVVVDRINGVRIAKKTPPSYIRTVSELQPYVDMGEPLRKHMRAVVLKFGSKEARLTRAYPDQMTRVAGKDVREYGTLTGRLERVSIHGGKSRFDVYPAVGPKKVQCLFKPSMLGKVKEGLGRFVTVEGTLYFKTWDRLPHKVRAESMEVPPEGETPSSLLSIRGLEPGISGKLSSEEHIQKLRDEDEW
jgi:hypothetical protein